MSWRRFRGLFGPDPRADVDDELTFHIEMRAQELVARGETPERARELALARFGDVEVPRRECVEIDERQGRRHARGEYVNELRQDVRYASRALMRAPAFATVAVVTLALGIGANSAIFSVIHAVLLNPLPFSDAARLHVVRSLYPDGAQYSMSAPDFMSVAADARVFDDVTAWASGTLTLTGAAEPAELRGSYLSRGTLQTLGMRLAIGRGFADEEHTPGAGRVVVLDHAYWQREFGGSADVLGRSLTLGGAPYSIIGVIADGFGAPNRPDVYVPIEYDESFDAGTGVGRRSEFLTVIARARPGVTPAQIEAELLRVGADLSERFPATNERITFASVGLRESLVGDVRGPLLVLLGAVGFVLLVACANVANLLLARASARRGELAVRAALGAGRLRLLRQLMTESLVLSLVGGALGLLLAWAGTRMLANSQAVEIPLMDSMGLNPTVLLVTLGVAVLTGLVFGAVPAVQATRGSMTPALRDDARGHTGGAGQRLRSALVVSEIAVAVVLLVGAGLLLRSFGELTRVNPGFTAAQALTFRISMGSTSYPQGEHVRAFTDRVLERLSALPGVTGVGAASALPLSGAFSLVGFAVEGAPPPPDGVNAEISILSVTPDYLATLGARIVAGRPITAQDRNGGPLVALINEAGARKWFPGEDPVGRQVDTGILREVVGVVSDVLQEDPGSAAVAELYTPHQQRTTRTLRVLLRTSGDPLALAPLVRAELRALDAALPISDIMPLEQVVAASVARPRFYTALLTLFAALALALAGIGIFGVMSYSVAQRAREISIRMALGARGREVVALVVGRSVLLALAGLTIGIAGALLLGRAIQSQLYGVRVTDPLALAASVIVLLLVAVLASWLPARRAAAVDPGLMLRG